MTIAWFFIMVLSVVGTFFIAFFHFRKVIQIDNSITKENTGKVDKEESEEYMLFIKYFCPHCERFKHWWQTTEGWGESVRTSKPSHCRHCGHKIIGVTKGYIEEALVDKLKSESED